jgi:hypothetical protein
MADTHVISGLKNKRAEVAGEIKDLERRLKYKRAGLAALDETLRLFDPDLDPNRIPARRAYKRAGYFKGGEVTRFVQAQLRDSAGPLAVSQITAALMAAKGLTADVPNLKASVGRMVGTVLRKMAKRGAVVKVGEGAGTRWALLPQG